MIDNVGLGALIRAAVVVGAEVDVSFPILEFLPGQYQGMTAAGTEKTGGGVLSCEYIQQRKSVFEQFHRKKGFFRWKPPPVEDVRKKLKNLKKGVDKRLGAW